MTAFIYTTIQDADDREYMLGVYQEFRNLMFYTAKKYISDQAVCEDIVQESIVKLIPKIDVIRGKERCIFAEYIVSVVRNVSMNYLKRESMQHKHMVGLDEEILNEIPAPGLSMEELLLEKEKASLLSWVLEQLPAIERLLLEGKYMLEYTDEELAQQIGCKTGSIRMKLTRARRHALSILSQSDWKGEDKNT